MDNALVSDQAADWSITLKPGSYTGDTKLQGNSAEFTFAKSSGIVTKDREKDWPIADRRDPSNNPRNNRGSNFFSNKIPFSFLKRRITQLKTALFSWVKGERLSYVFYPHFRKKFPWLSKNARKYSGDFWRLPNDAVSIPSSRSRHATFRTTDWNILGGDWIKVFQFMTSRSEFWVRNWRFPSFMIVQWTSNVGGQRARQGSFCHVQLISPKIISPVGEGTGELLNNV